MHVDPYASANEAYLPYVDSAMRHVTGSLLSMYSLPERVTSNANVGTAEEVTQCLEYVRERTSVPRDMTVHAARLFRAHINLYIDSI